MKANELRIGNYVLFNHIHYRYNNNSYIMVEGIYDDDLYFYEDDSRDSLVGNPLSNFSPIPLTEEWLLNLGFVKGLSGAFYIGDCIFHISGYLSDKFDDYMIKDNIKYVHQLQNIFFALTGEELIVDKEKQ